ncbi:hypothetical protein [Bosea sp. (in: a-proteobacteria)]|uniref:hypothetical protein n=1 Tax=Bosea sp. (in: a-proteobacteria) TaxID=1871050 RepID=UPI0040343893
MPKQRPKTGDLGENSFSAWCSQLAMDAVKAVPDRNGWDYLVEFDRERRISASPDTQHNSVKAYVQIKATEKSNSKISGKLSAFKALVSADTPAFVVKLEFGKGIQPTRCRLLHIGEPQIAAVLKRVREAHRDGIKLHDINFSLPLDGGKIAEFGSEELRLYIEGCVGQSTSDYISKKDEIRKRVGYGSDAFKFKFSVKNDDDEGFIDFLIGKIPEIDVSHIVMSETRFDIELPSDRISEGGKLKISRHESRKVSVVARSDSVGSERRVRADLYFPPVPNLPRDMIKFRIVNNFIDIDISHRKDVFTMRMNIPFEEKLPVSDLSEALKFFSLMSHGDSEIGIDLENGSFAHGRNLSLMTSLAPYRGLSNFADELMRAFAVSDRDFSKNISLKELEDVYRTNSASRRYLDDGGTITARAQLNERVESLTSSGNILIPLCFDFDEFSYIGIAKSDIFEAIVDKEGNMNVTAKSNRIIERSILSPSKDNYMKANDRVNRIAQATDSAGRIIIWPSLVPID